MATIPAPPHSPCPIMPLNPFMTLPPQSSSQPLRRPVLESLSNLWSLTALHHPMRPHSPCTSPCPPKAPLQPCTLMVAPAVRSALPERASYCPDRLHSIVHPPPAPRVRLLGVSWWCFLLLLRAAKRSRGETPGQWSDTRRGGAQWSEQSRDPCGLQPVAPPLACSLGASQRQSPSPSSPCPYTPCTLTVLSHLPSLSEG